MIGSPHIVSTRNSVRLLMAKVMAALVPATLAHAWFFGPGIWVSLVLCLLFGLFFEAFALGMRGYPIKPFLTDGSVLLTGWLLALSLPTLAPWWLYAVGMLFAVGVAKHLYGGLGQNLFNPAMVGYAVLIISFPLQMTQWAAPTDLAVYVPDLAEAADLVLSGQGSVSPDAYTGATPLDSLRTQLLNGRPVAEAMAQPTFGYLAGRGGEMVAVMYLLGGVLMLLNGVITWRIPLSFLAGIAGTALVLQLIDPARHAGPLFHLFSGGAMLGAFFIATDPVSAATTPRGQLLFGGLAGVLTVVIRAFGGYPDGVAFSVLLMNMAAPLIDTYTQPRVFGASESRRPKA